MFWSHWKYLRLRKNKNKSAEHKPVVLITGCGSGIGLALAELFYANEGYRVVITSRSRTAEFLHKKFKESERFLIRNLDVTDEHSRIRLVREIDDRFGGVNVLINNAGILYRAVIEHMTEKDEQLQMQTNYFGAMGLIRLVLPLMRIQGRGKIINVSSVSGMLAMPTMASYSASKHALEGASEALWYEMKPLGIGVSLIQPGFIRSNSFENIYYTEKSNPRIARTSDYRDYYENMTPFIAKLMGLSPTTPEDIAKLVLKTVRTENPPLWVMATPDARIFYYLRWLMPRWLMLPILFWLLPNSKSWAKGYSRRRDWLQARPQPVEASEAYPDRRNNDRRRSGEGDDGSDGSDGSAAS